MKRTPHGSLTGYDQMVEDREEEAAYWHNRPNCFGYSASDFEYDPLREPVAREHTGE